jgi:hypothetical protein
MRAPVAHAPQVPGMIEPRFIGAHADRYGEAGRAQPCMTGAGHRRIWIFERQHDAGHACGDDRVGTWRRLSVVRARLEGDVEVGAARGLAGAAQGLDFRMRPAAGLGPAAADDPRRAAIAADNDGADRRVRPSAA